MFRGNNAVCPCSKSFGSQIVSLRLAAAGVHDAVLCCDCADDHHCADRITFTRFISSSNFSAAQLLGCMTLFWFAMVLKTIIARAVSSHFMKEAHFAKMKAALEKVGTE